MEAKAEDIHYEWMVNNELKDSTTEPSFTYTFPTKGNHTVSVKAFTGNKEIGEFKVSVIVSTAGKELSKATSKVNIKKQTTPVNHLPILQQNGYFEANMNIRARVHIYDKYSTPIDSEVEENAYFWTAATPIFWDGTKFSGSRNDVDAAGTTISQTIQGTVSSDGNTVLSLTCQLQVEATDQSTNVRFSLQNIPIKYINDTLDNFYLTSIDVQKYVVELEKKVQSKYMGEVYHSITYLSPVWASDDSLQVVFRKTLNP